MARAIRHAVSLLDYLLHSSEHAGADARVLHDLAWPADARRRLPRGLDLQWLGTAGFALSFQGTTLLIDPYVTRAGLRRLLSRQAIVSDTAAVDRWVPRADAIVVGHTHFDHALDAPAIARRDACPVFGGGSLVRLMELHGLGPMAVEVQPDRVYEVGPFEVTFVPSAHSKLLLGAAVPSSGEIESGDVASLTAWRYACGQVWGIDIRVAGVSIYHQGSADLIDDAIGRRSVDYFLCAIAGRSFTPRYTERILSRLAPSVVVPSHFDDFLRPLEAPATFAPHADLAGFVDEVRATSRSVEVRTLRPGERV